MAKLISARGAQNVMEAEFTFNFDDTMVPYSGGTAIAGTTEVDFGKTNITATQFGIINMPEGAVEHPNIEWFAIDSMPPFASNSVAG